MKQNYKKHDILVSSNQVSTIKQKGSCGSFRSRLTVRNKKINACLRGCKVAIDKFVLIVMQNSLCHMFDILFFPK